MPKTNIVVLIAMLTALVFTATPAVAQPQLGEAVENCDTGYLADYLFANPTQDVAVFEQLSQDCADALIPMLVSVTETSWVESRPDIAGALDTGTTSTCTTRYHTVTYHFAGTAKFNVINNKTWCWSYNSSSGWRVTPQGAVVYSQSVSANTTVIDTNETNGWMGYPVVHQTLATGVAIIWLGFDYHVSQTNSVCGGINGQYSYNNDCS